MRRVHTSSLDVRVEMSGVAKKGRRPDLLHLMVFRFVLALLEWQAAMMMMMESGQSFRGAGTLGTQMSVSYTHLTLPTKRIV